MSKSAGGFDPPPAPVPPEATPGGPVLGSCTVVNNRGLHARAAAKLVKLAGTFDAEVSIECQGAKVPATSILGLMMLGAGRGSVLALEATGPDATAAVAALVALVEHGFDESD